MSRIFFISVNTEIEPYPVYPLGMSVCAAALTAEGHEVRQFDLLAAGKSGEIVFDSLEDFQPEVVCFSLRNIDSGDSFASQSEWFLDSLKRLVDRVHGSCPVPLIIGGPGFSIMPDEILAHVGIGYGIRGEGERSLCQLLGMLEKREEVPHIFPVEVSPLAGTAVPSPLYDKALVNFYLEESGLVNIQSKRGCPHRCNYCTYPQIEGKTFRARPAEAVVDDIERMKLDFHVNDFFFTDSVFNDSQGHYIELVEEILRRDLRIRWGSFFTPQFMPADSLSLMKRSGLVAVELGTDAGCDRTLAALDKDFTFDQVLAFNDACVKNEIPCCHFIMFGGPGEDKTTIRESLINLEKLKYCVVCGFSGIRIFPGTGIHQLAISEGFVEASESLLKPKYYFSPGIGYDKMNELLTAGFAGRRDRVFPPGDGKLKRGIMKKFGFKGILWDRLIKFPK